MDYFRFSKTVYGIAQIYYTPFDIGLEDAEHCTLTMETQFHKGNPENEYISGAFAD